MKGVVVKKANIVSDDSRRTITEIMNGDMNIKNIKILHIKKGEEKHGGQQLLGNHWHPYSEVMYMIQGRAIYKMKNIDTGEEEIFNLIGGDVVYRTGRIVHAGFFEEDSMVLDGACETYVSADFNDVFEEILK